MRPLLSVLIALTLCLSPATGKQSRPIPPGIREADARVNKPVEPPASAGVSSPDKIKLKQEAEELARLAGTIPAQVETTAQGRLPKDLSDKLKRIEKLAKHLRSEISE